MDYPTSADMVVREGSNVSLKCAASGSPKPTITWRREDGEAIPLGNGREGKHSSNKYILTLLTGSKTEIRCVAVTSSFFGFSILCKVNI